METQLMGICSDWSNHFQFSSNQSGDRQ